MKVETQKDDLKIKNHKRFIRTSYAVYVTLILFTIFFSVLNFYDGLIYSCYAGIFAVIGYFTSMYFLIKKKEFIKGTFAVYLTLGPGAVCASYFEGLMSGYIWFLFSMVYAIPFMIKREDYFLKQTRILYVFTFSLIAITVIMSPMYSKVHSHITVEASHTKFLIISIACFTIIMILNMLALNTGKIYVQKLFNAKQQAIQEKESRTRTLSNIGHELRTQINSINGITQLILENNQDKNKKESKYIKVLEHCNSNMLVLVNDMLDMHKIESGGFELFEEPKLIDKVLSKVTTPFINKIEDNNLTLKTEIDKNVKDITINVDETRLLQVLYNLISNAIKFTKQGSITFTTSLVNETFDSVSIRFSVRDTGIGISSKHFNTIFDSFQQIKNNENPVYGGTGLGLAISKTIVEKMGSRIEVESAVNKGTEFYFTIEFNKLGAVPIKLNSKHKFNRSFLSNVNILVVEDNAVSMLYVDKLLNAHGAKTYQAINGLEAVNKVKTHDTIDIVLLDLEMPVMNGYKAVKKIKAINQKLTVIAFTANIPTEELVLSLHDYGFDDIISKPFKREQLLTTLQNNISWDLKPSKIA